MLPGRRGSTLLIIAAAEKRRMGHAWRRKAPH
jgi:hypothetical protein